MIDDVAPVMWAWAEEPHAGDERAYTPWAEPGWSAWNLHSAEREFCEFAGALARLVGGPIIETGCGQGYTTRRVAASGGELTCYESDPAIRSALADLPFFGRGGPRLSEQATPSAKEMSMARLVLLDSDLPFRLSEMEDWVSHAPSGSTLLVHDLGTPSHPEDSVHMDIRRKAKELGMLDAGVHLRNPRGGLMVVK